MARICRKCGLITEAEEKCPNCGQSFSSAVPAAPAVVSQPAPKPVVVAAAPAEAASPAAPAAVAPAPQAMMPAPEAQTVVAPATAPKAAEPKVRCSQCGSMTIQGEKCEVCGASLPQKKEASPAAPAPVAPEPTPVVVPAPTPVKVDWGKMGRGAARLVARGLAASSRFLAQAANKPAQPKPAAPAPKPESRPTRQANGAKKRPSVGRILLIVAVIAAFGYVLRDCARGDFWKKLGAVSTPAPTSVSAKGSVSPMMTPTPIRTATVEQTKTSAPSRATELVDRIRRLVFLRIGALVLGGFGLLLAVFLLLQKRRGCAAVSAAAGITLLLLGGGVWLALSFLGPATPTGTPTPIVDLAVEEAAKKTLEAKAPTATPTLLFERKVETAVAATASALTATPTPTNTPTLTKKSEPSATPTKVSEVVPTATPTKPAPPIRGLNRQVSITGSVEALRGKDGQYFWSQIAVECFDGKDQKVGQVPMFALSQTVVLPESTVQIKLWIGDLLGGSGWWKTWYVDHPRPVTGGDSPIVLTITSVFNRGRPG